MSSGLVFNVQRFSTDDGEGIRSCVFLKGCPLRCAWCHNAEGISFSPEIAFYEQNCVGCGACVSACQRGALSLRQGKALLDRGKCVACGQCAEHCSSSALVKVGRKMTVDEVMQTVRRDRIFYGSKGGVTITGGEPMAQAAFTVALARAAKNEGISVAVETSGYGRREDFLKLAPYCDVFLFDCKASAREHLRLTGVDVAPILQNLDAVCRVGARVRLRCPIVPNANLCDEFMQGIADLAVRYDSVESVQLMPYHKTGSRKNDALGKSAQPIFEAPRDDELWALVERLKALCPKNVFF